MKIVRTQRLTWKRYVLGPMVVWRLQTAEEASVVVAFVTRQLDGTITWKKGDHMRSPEHSAPSLRAARAAAEKAVGARRV